MAIDKELAKQGYEHSNCEGPAEMWVNKKAVLGFRFEWFRLVARK